MVRRPPVGRAAARGAIAVLITALVLSTSFAPAQAALVHVAGATRASRAPVVVIVLENHEYRSINARSAPYLKRFARGGTLFTHFHALHHPSLPNYLEMTSGHTGGCHSDGCAKARIRSRNVFSQLSHNGVSWAAWAESMGSRCRTNSAGPYASWHNPPLYYRDLMRKVCSNRDVPYPKHLPRYLPKFVFAVPNLCHDMHDCSVATGNKWLKNHVPPLLHRGAIVIITFDEGVTNVGGGGHIFTAMRGPGVPHGKRNARTYSHRGLLAAIERHFGMLRLFGARHARRLPIP